MELQNQYYLKKGIRDIFKMDDYEVKNLTLAREIPYRIHYPIGTLIDFTCLTDRRMDNKPYRAEVIEDHSEWFNVLVFTDSGENYVRSIQKIDVLIGEVQITLVQ